MNDNDFLENLRNGDKNAFEQLYREVFPEVAYYIKSKGGSQQDAEDIFQESLMALVKNIRRPDFKLTAKIKTYLKRIAKNKWAHRLREHKKMPKAPIQAADSLSVTFENESILAKEKYELKHKVITILFRELKADCQQLLKAYHFEHQSHKSIAEKMNYSVKFIKPKKKRCWNAFKKLIEAHPDFKHFM